MENLNDIKTKLIQKICESQDYYLLSSLLKNFENKPINTVKEPGSVYEFEKPMTEEEVDAYFKEEELELPSEILEILKLSENQIKSGHVYSNIEVNAYFEEWLKD